MQRDSGNLSLLVYHRGPQIRLAQPPADSSEWDRSSRGTNSEPREIGLRLCETSAMTTSPYGDSDPWNKPHDASGDQFAAEYVERARQERHSSRRKPTNTKAIWAGLFGVLAGGVIGAGIGLVAWWMIGFVAWGSSDSGWSWDLFRTWVGGGTLVCALVGGLFNYFATRNE